MNPNINALEQQCWSHRVDGVLVDGHLHFDTKKFAELLIKQCIKICEDGTSTQTTSSGAAILIRQRFGIKE